MAQLKNTDKLASLELGQAVAIGHNRNVERVKGGFRCTLHGNGIAFFSELDASGIIRVTLNDCGYPTVTTRNAMRDFARAFGCTLSVSFAKGGFSIRFKNAAGHYVDRELERGTSSGPIALGRYV
jgi:hypothetical protein